MSSPTGGEFDNTQYQKDLAEKILSDLHSGAGTSVSRADLYEQCIAPLGNPPSRELVWYVMERMSMHPDCPLNNQDDDGECVCLTTTTTIPEYVQIHLKTSGDPFPPLDPEDYLEDLSLPTR